MIVQIPVQSLKTISGLILFLLVLSMFASLSFLSNSVSAFNISNTTVIARVNVSNTEPTLYYVNIVEPLDASGNIDLIAGNSTFVICNGTFMDPNGFDDVHNISATLYRDSVGSTAQDNPNDHYTNSSCFLNCSVVEGSGSLNGTCSCQFAVQYWAEPANDWRCNMTINDTGGLSDANFSITRTLNEVLGIGVSSNVIDYGNMSSTQTSAATPHNVTNFGNIPINITIKGYGGTDPNIGINYSMLCDPAFSSTNISLTNERYSSTTTNFDDMFNLSNSSVMLPLLTLDKRRVSNVNGNETNTTYWRLRVPFGAGGLCNGTIIFGAIDAT